MILETHGDHVAALEVSDGTHPPVTRTWSYSVAPGPTEPYDIVVRPTAALDPAVAAATDAAVARWERVITRGVPDVTASVPAGYCGTGGQPFDGTIDEFVGWAFRLLGRYAATMHLVANHLSTVAGDAAVAETYGISHHRSDDADPRRNLTVGFRYLDRLERRDGGPWLIARRIATTEWVTAPVEGSRWEIPPTDTLGRRGPEDPLFALLAELEG